MNGMATTNIFPEWVSPPGATIRDILEARGRSLEDFAQEMDLSTKITRGLISGSTSINEELADGLARFLGSTSAFWLSREEQYREALARRDESEVWLRGIPVAEMVKLEWVERLTSPRDKINSCLQFFGVPTVHDWFNKYEGAARLAAFRTSEVFTSDEGAVLAWLRKGEIEAETIESQAWDRDRFRSTLPELRSLTLVKDPEEFIPRMQSICAESGVAVVVAKTPKGCRASGATRFLSPNKALLMLSFRYLVDDHFWFTFFHEAAHLLLHDESMMFLEGDALSSGDAEQEANAFSENLLIPAEFQREMGDLSLTPRAIMKFARKIGVSPGIVVGQLQHRGLCRHSHFNPLKVRYQWG